MLSFVPQFVNWDAILMPAEASVLTPTSIAVDLYTIELNKAIQKILKNDPKRALNEPFYKKDLLLLIFKPNEVPGLTNNPRAREAAHALYLSLQQEAMNKVAARFNEPPPSYEEAILPESSAPPMSAVMGNNRKVETPPSYSDAYNAYQKNRQYCEQRRERWCGNEYALNDPYYSNEYLDTYILVNTVRSALELTLYGAMLIPDMVRVGAEVGTHAGSSCCLSSHHIHDCGCKELGVIFAAIIIAGITLGLLAFATSELIKAYQEDKDTHSSTRKFTIIAPTLLASAAAGYFAAAYFSVLTGLTVSTGGIALAVIIAVSVTAALSVLIFKWLTNVASTHRYKLNENEKERLEARGVDTKKVQSTIATKSNRIHTLDGSCHTLFFSDTNDAIRNERRRIYNLRTHGYEETPPAYSPR